MIILVFSPFQASAWQSDGLALSPVLVSLDHIQMFPANETA